MNQFVCAVLVVCGLAWLAYMAGWRDKRLAFALWFPATATTFIGTLVWLWAALVFLTAPGNLGAAGGFALMGIGILLGALLFCPIVFALSIWQRPKAGAYSLVSTLPIIAVYVSLVFLYRPFSGVLENEQMQLVVLDTGKKPVAHAKVKYQTIPRSLGMFSFPSVSTQGEVETGPDGTVLFVVPVTHELFGSIEAEGYANISIQMDRSWNKDWPWRQTSVSWNFPGPPNRVWNGQSGIVQFDVNESNPMQLNVYLPRKNADIPEYPPVHIYSGKTKKWTLEPSQIHY